MTPQQPQAAPPLVPVGGEMILLGHRFQVVGHSMDKNGNAVEIPGKHLGPAPRQSKRAGQAAVAPTEPTAHAPTSGPQLTPPAAPRRLKPRRYKAPRGDCRRFQKKPPPLVIVNEPWTLANWVGLIVVLALIVAAIWLSSAGSEQHKWDSIGTERQRD